MATVAPRQQNNQMELFQERPSSTPDGFQSIDLDTWTNIPKPSIEGFVILMDEIRKIRFLYTQGDDKMRALMNKAIEN